jgi:hypothetical protein
VLTEGGLPRAHHSGGDILSRRALFNAKEAEMPLTTVIGIKYKEGIMLYSDTQETLPSAGIHYTRNPFQGKLSALGKYYACGCSGNSGDIDKFVNELKLAFIDAPPYSDEELYAKLSDLIVSFYEKLKNESKRMYDKPDYFDFSCTCLFAAALSKIDPVGIGKFGLYRIVIEVEKNSDKNPKPYVNKILFYDCIGTGRDIARTFLTLIEALMNLHGYRYFKLSRKLCAMIGHVVTALTSKVDLESGGTIHDFNITENGVSAFWQKEYWDEKENPIIQTLETFANEVELDLTDLGKLMDKDKQYFKRFKGRDNSIPSDGTQQS